jgi:CDP-paratose 2-epimerase
MKILITGGCGFLGSNLAAEALKKQEELIIIDNLSRLGAENNLKWLKQKGKFTFHLSDIRDHLNLDNIIKKQQPDVVFHLAGQVAMTTSIEDPKYDFEVNTLGTLNLLEAIRKYSPKTIVIYSSTNKVYGDLNWVNYTEKDTRYIAKDFLDGFSEDTPLEFSSPYGCSKGAADQYMLDYYRIFNIQTVVFRHSSMYGERQFATFDQGWIGWFCKKAMEIKNNQTNEPISISGNGKQVRDVLHSQDMINLYFAAVKNIDKVSGKAFNIGGGMSNSLSLLELFNLLEKKLSINIEYNKLPPRMSDQKIFVADLKSISEAISWEPKVNSNIGIDDMLKWTSENI